MSLSNTGEWSHVQAGLAADLSGQWYPKGKAYGPQALCYTTLLRFTADTLMGGSYLWLVVVLHRHSDDIDPNDECDEEVKIVAGAKGMNVLPCWGIVSIVRPALGFCRKRQRKATQWTQALLRGWQPSQRGLWVVSYTRPDSARGRSDSSKPREMAKCFYLEPSRTIAGLSGWAKLLVPAEGTSIALTTKSVFLLSALCSYCSFSD